MKAKCNTCEKDYIYEGQTLSTKDYSVNSQCKECWHKNPWREKLIQFKNQNEERNAFELMEKRIKEIPEEIKELENEFAHHIAEKLRCTQK